MTEKLFLLYFRKNAGVCLFVPVVQCRNGSVEMNFCHNQRGSLYALVDTLFIMISMRGQHKGVCVRDTLDSVLDFSSFNIILLKPVVLKVRGAPQCVFHNHLNHLTLNYFTCKLFQFLFSV